MRGWVPWFLPGTVIGFSVIDDIITNSTEWLSYGWLYFLNSAVQCWCRHEGNQSPSPIFGLGWVVGFVQNCWEIFQGLSELVGWFSTAQTPIKKLILLLQTSLSGLEVSVGRGPPYPGTLAMPLRYKAPFVAFCLLALFSYNKLLKWEYEGMLKGNLEFGSDLHLVDFLYVWYNHSNNMQNHYQCTSIYLYPHSSINVCKTSQLKYPLQLVEEFCHLLCGNHNYWVELELYSLHFILLLLVVEYVWVRLMLKCFW